MYCDLSADLTSGQCAPTLPTGAVCDADVACKSGICFTPQGTSADAGAGDAGGASICSVPLGGSCFTDDCDQCFNDDPSEAWCSADCSMRHCPENFVCLSFATPYNGGEVSDCYETCTNSSTCPPGNSCQYYPINSAGTLSSTGACQACTLEAPCP